MPGSTHPAAAPLPCRGALGPRRCSEREHEAGLCRRSSSINIWAGKHQNHGCRDAGKGFSLLRSTRDAAAPFPLFAFFFFFFFLPTTHASADCASHKAMLIASQTQPGTRLSSQSASLADTRFSPPPTSSSQPAPSRGPRTAASCSRPPRAFPTARGAAPAPSHPCSWLC